MAVIIDHNKLVVITEPKTDHPDLPKDDNNKKLEIYSIM